MKFYNFQRMNFWQSCIEETKNSLRWGVLAWFQKMVGYQNDCNRKFENIRSFKNWDGRINGKVHDTFVRVHSSAVKSEHNTQIANHPASSDQDSTRAISNGIAICFALHNKNKNALHFTHLQICQTKKENRKSSVWMCGLRKENILNRILSLSLSHLNTNGIHAQWKLQWVVVVCLLLLLFMTFRTFTIQTSECSCCLRCYEPMIAFCVITHNQIFKTKSAAKLKQISKKIHPNL